MITISCCRVSNSGQVTAHLHLASSTADLSSAKATFYSETAKQLCSCSSPLLQPQMPAGNPLHLTSFRNGYISLILEPGDYTFQLSDNSLRVSTVTDHILCTVKQRDVLSLKVITRFWYFQACLSLAAMNCAMWTAPLQVASTMMRNSQSESERKSNSSALMLQRSLNPCYYPSIFVGEWGKNVNHKKSASIRTLSVCVVI